MENPNGGILAAEAVRHLAEMYQNHLSHVEGQGMVKLEPPQEVDLPPLRTYTFVQVTGQIITKLVSDTRADETPSKPKKGKIAVTPSPASKGVTPPPKKTATSDSKKKSDPPVPAPDDAEEIDEDEDEDQDEDDEDEDDEEGAEGGVDELNLLDKLGAAVKKNKRKGAPAKGAPKKKSKKGAKSEAVKK